MSVSRRKSMVKASCPDCGEVITDIAKVRLQLTNKHGAGARYAFTCPCCSAWVSKPASFTEARILLTGGVQPELVPAEILERGSPTGPPITDAEIQSFVDELDSSLAQLDELGS